MWYENPSLWTILEPLCYASYATLVYGELGLYILLITPVWRLNWREHQLGTNQMAPLPRMVPLHNDMTFSKHLWSTSQVWWLFFSFTNPLYLLSFNCSCFNLPFDLFLVNLNLFLYFFFLLFLLFFLFFLFLFQLLLVVYAILDTRQ